MNNSIDNQEISVGFLGGITDRLRKKRQQKKSPMHAIAPPKVETRNIYKLEVAGEVVAHIQFTREPKYRGADEADHEIRVRVVWTDVGLPMNVFLPLWQVEGFDTKDFKPNQKLPESLQLAQRELHAFLCHTLDQVKDFKRRYEDLIKQQEEREVNNPFASFARDSKTCDDIRELVLGRSRIYRIQDDAGKWMVLTVTNPNDSIRFTVKFIEAGHELDGKVSLGVFTKLDDLRMSNLSEENIPLEARELHAFLRCRAMRAGVKPSDGTLNNLRLQQLDRKFG